MKALVRRRYGPAEEVLSLEDLDLPAVGDDEVLVRVCAAGVGPNVWHAVTGAPYVARLGFGLRTPKALVPQSDLAGVVQAAGSRAGGFRPGDEVFGTSPGALADYACARADRLAPKPANLSVEQAAAVPVAGCAALHALRDVGRVREGQRVLIVGASGGVGSFAVQIAKAFDAHVTGVCRTANFDLVRSLGADELIDYTKSDFTDGSRRYDLIVDLAGRRPLRRLRGALERRGTLVIVGGEGGGRFTGGFGRAVLRAPLLSLVTTQRLRPLISVERQADLLDLKELIEAGKVTSVVTRTFPLADAAHALSDRDEGHGLAKTVVTMPGRPSEDPG
ncbi:MAG: NAD(P)-dependent alcohol dehydrogenase [Acidimicrobiales bacterium]